MKGRITQRDSALLESLCCFGVLSFQQIANMHFDGLNKATIHNRLTLLGKRGLIERIRVGRLLYRYESREIGVVLRPTKEAISVVRLRDPNLLLKAEPVRISSIDLLHDLLLIDAIENLRQRFPGLDFRNSKTLPVNALPPGRIPDAVALAASKSIVVAIELEISAKSERRYRQILTGYRVSPKVEKVLYLTSAKAVEDKLVSILAHRPSDNVPVPTGKFYFANLPELLRDPANVSISNGAEQLRFNSNLTKEIA